MCKKTILIISVLLFSFNVESQKKFLIFSPDKRVNVALNIETQITYTLVHDSNLLINASPLSLTISNGQILGKNAKVLKSKKNNVSEFILSPFSKSDRVQNKYNELIIDFKGNWGLIFRVYNDGLAYRFVSKIKEPFEVINEVSQFNFPDDYKAIIPYIRNHHGGKKETFEQQYQRSFESTYDILNISKIDEDRLMFLPIVVDNGNGKKLCITEVDLESYPGMFLNKVENNSLKGEFAPFPKKTTQGGHNMIQQVVKEREGYIARVNSPRSFPWRAVIISSEDKELAVTDMTYRLAAPSRVKDTSWIKPGKVAWEWWHKWNIYNVDFESGINTETYKYYIDFASKHNIEYVILDEGWSPTKSANLMQIIPDLNLNELINYANDKNVGIILWAGYWAFDKDMESVCRHYSEMGIKGFKVDFMNRDDQQMVDFVYRASETAAKYNLVLNFHGMYKPAGLQRTFPNILNFEGVFGLEQLKVRDNVDMVMNDLIIPFTRMVAGPLDYTQGAMRNANQENFRAIFSEPMSQGTRCRQLALYVIYESPMNMLCDSPTEYMKEQESLDFISQIPTVWSESVALDGKIGEYLTIARRYQDEWYVGGITNWEPKEMTIALDFLSEGYYELIQFEDGPNAHNVGKDYTRKVRTVNSNDNIDVKMAPGGGFALKLKKIDNK